MTIATNPGKGTALAHGVTTTFTNVGQNVSLEGPELTVVEADTTHLASTLKTSRPVIPDPGELTGKVWYDPSDTLHKLMFGLIAGQTIEPWKLIFADAANGPSTWAFNGWLKSFKPTGMEVESNLEADFTIRLTSLPVQTP